MSSVGEPTLCVFANFFIENEERLQRMKDSLKSMSGIIVRQYVINVRGQLSEEAADYLRSNLENAKVFTLQSVKGWFYDTSKINQFITATYVLFWLEDHLCRAPDLVNAVVKEMSAIDADILTYTFWQNGKFLERYSKVPQKSGQSITWFDHTRENNQLVQSSKTGKSYLISCASIIKTSLFNRIVENKDFKARWAKETPFDFEKHPEDVYWLPLRRAISKDELFASIDDDHGVAGSCLQSRGIYPRRIERQSYAKKKGSNQVTRIFPKALSIILVLIRILSNYFKTPAKYRIDYLLSFVAPGMLKNNPLPWMNYLVVDYLILNQNCISTVFEYGSGCSTLFWAKQGKSVVSVEHDPDFYRDLEQQVAALQHVHYKLSEPEPDMTFCRAMPSSINSCHSADFKGYTFKKYVESILDYQDEFFDAVIIDGRSRPSCIARSIQKLKFGGLLVLDNSNREYYLREAGKILAGWEKRVFFGTVRGLYHCEQTSCYIKPLSRVQFITGDHIESLWGCHDH